MSDNTATEAQLLLDFAKDASLRGIEQNELKRKHGALTRQMRCVMLASERYSPRNAKDALVKRRMRVKGSNVVLLSDMPVYARQAFHVFACDAIALIVEEFHVYYAMKKGLIALGRKVIMYAREYKLNENIALRLVRDLVVYGFGPLRHKENSTIVHLVNRMFACTWTVELLYS